MQEVEALIGLFRRAQQDGRALFLATVVHVDGSAYRKPGARMLVSSTGERAGQISGGCLEAEVAKRIAWITRDGASLERYSSSFDDDNDGTPPGLGCNGTVWIMMETGQAVTSTMLAIERASTERRDFCSLVIMSGPRVGTAIIAGGGSPPFEELLFPALLASSQEVSCLREDADAALKAKRVHPSLRKNDRGLPIRVSLPIASAPAVTVFGAGDDARPLVSLMRTLGWEVTVADGRSHLLKRQRFSEKTVFCPLRYQAVSEDNDSLLELVEGPALNSRDSAVILTHSYVQDRALLQQLLPVGLRYLGVLGPLHRTERILRSLTSLQGLSFEACLSRLHAPVGLRLGSDDPYVIALSIVAEMQAVWSGTEGCVERL